MISYSQRQRNEGAELTRSGICNFPSSSFRPVESRKRRTLPRSVFTICDWDKKVSCKPCSRAWFIQPENYFLFAIIILDLIKPITKRKKRKKTLNQHLLLIS